jgi:hypothetical protein
LLQREREEGEEAEERIVVEDARIIDYFEIKSGKLN